MIPLKLLTELKRPEGKNEVFIVAEQMAKNLCKML